MNRHQETLSRVKENGMVRVSNFFLAISFLLFVPAAFAGEFQIKVIDPHSAAVAGAQVFVYRAEDSAPAQVRSTSGEGYRPVRPMICRCRAG